MRLFALASTLSARVFLLPAFLHTQQHPVHHRILVPGQVRMHASKEGAFRASLVAALHGKHAAMHTHTHTHVQHQHLLPGQVKMHASKGGGRIEPAWLQPCTVNMPQSTHTHTRTAPAPTAWTGENGVRGGSTPAQLTRMSYLYIHCKQHVLHEHVGVLCTAPAHQLKTDDAVRMHSVGNAVVVLT
jgi:hypothetical protein